MQRSKTGIVNIKCGNLGSIPLQRHNLSGTVVFKCHCIKITGGINLPGGIDFPITSAISSLGYNWANHPFGEKHP